MKYLKSYKIFESLDSIFGGSQYADEVWNDISDILLELEDEGFLVTKEFINIRMVSNKLCEDVIEIVVNKNSTEGFRYEEVKDTFMRLIDYLKSYDWNYSILYFSKVEYIDSDGNNDYKYGFIEFECGGKDPLAKVDNLSNYGGFHGGVLKNAFKICLYRGINRLISRI